jgi:hypothetical protein
MIRDLRLVVAACAGGLLGAALFFWLAARGYYGLALPGGLLGLGAGVFRPHSAATPVLCGVLAVGLGLVVEWRFAPFVADSSFSFFLTHLTGLQLPTVVMLAIGAVVGFWVPFRRRASAGAPSARASA